MEEKQEIVVGIGEIAVSHNPTILTALGLGSCVGVALYDKEAHVGGLAHIMLPKSSEFGGKLSAERDISKLMKYADVAIPKIIGEMEKIGAKKSSIRAKIAGGAQVFEGMNNEILQIGARNLDAVKKVLLETHIPIDAEDTGGRVGRSIRFDISTQKMKIKAVNGEKEI